MRIQRLHCFQHVHWHPDRHELRRFAGSMLLGFLVLGLIGIWRRHGVTPATWVLWSLGLALAIGALMPRLGRWVYLGVHVPTSLIGYVISHVLLTLMFLVVFIPLGVLLRLTGKDLLRRQRPRGVTLWIPRPEVADPNRCYRQF